MKAEQTAADLSTKPTDGLEPLTRLKQAMKLHRGSTMTATKLTMTATTMTATNHDHDGHNHDGHKL